MLDYLYTYYRVFRSVAFVLLCLYSSYFMHAIIQLSLIKCANLSNVFLVLSLIIRKLPFKAITNLSAICNLSPISLCLPLPLSHSPTLHFLNYSLIRCR